MRPRYGMLSLALASLAASPAAAATRSATALGGASSGACEVSAPCTLAYALSGAASGDDVTVGAGDHTLFAGVTVGGTITVRGAAGGPRPRIHYAGPAAGFAIRLLGSGSKVEHLDVDGQSEAALVGVGGTPTAGVSFDRVQIRNQGVGYALIAGASSSIRNSVLATVGGGAALVMSGTLTGSTVVSESPSSSALSVTTSYYHLAEVTVRNSILRGGVSDVEVRDTDGGGVYRASVDIDYSAVRADRIVKSGLDTAMVIGASNIAADPLFAAPSGAADLRQLAGSSTVGAGSALAASGLDLDGDPRTVGSAPDIGADEFVPPPTLTGETVSAVGASTATIDASINPNSRATTYYVQYGPSTAYGSRTPDTPAGSANAPEGVRIPLAGLAGGTTYHARIIARSDHGESFGTDISFSTPGTSPRPASPSLAGTVDTLAPMLGGLAVLQKKSARSLRLTLSEPARIDVRVERLQSGRTRSGRCVVKATRGRSCVRSERVGSFQVARSQASAGVVAIPTRIGRNVLPTGRLRFTVVAVDIAGNRSEAKSLIATIR